MGPGAGSRRGWRISGDKLAPFVSAINYEWTGHRLDFTVTALRPTVNGRIEREEARGRVELGLPLLLPISSAGITGRIRTEGSLLLNGPAKP